MAENAETNSTETATVSTETEPEETLESLRAELDRWKKSSRTHEASAKTNAEAASRLKEIEDAQKTAEQKALEELAAYKAEAESSKAQLLKYEVATTKNVPAALLNGSTKEELEAQADALLAFRGEAPQAPVATPNLRQGAQGQTTLGDVNANLRSFLHRR